jgi:opacity protein-like surface antigen
MVMRHTTTFVVTTGLLLALSNLSQAQSAPPDKRVNFSFGAGWTAPTSNVRDRFGDGYNFNLGVQVNATPVIGIEFLYGYNGLGEKNIQIPVHPTPADGADGVPTDFFANTNMQSGTVNLIMRRPVGMVRPYGLVGMGVYYRPVEITTPSVGWVNGYCDPYWYVCVPGGFVETDRIVGDRSSTDFGMDFGGGVNFGYFYAEVRYHYIWGPKFEVPAGAVNVSNESGDLKANGKYFLTTFGVRF